MAALENTSGHEFIEDGDQNTGNAEEKREMEHLENTFGFCIKSSRTDIIFLVEGKKLYATRVVLEMISPVFEDQFRQQLDDCKESEGREGQNEVILEGIFYRNFAEFLACVYPGNLLSVSMDNVHHVLPLACEYKVNFLKKKCEAVLLEALSDTQPDEGFFIECFNHGKRYQLLTLKQKCWEKIIKRRLEKITFAEDELPLEPEDAKEFNKAIVSQLRSEASRNRFFSAGPQNQNHVNLSDFVDAKYKSLNFLLKKDQSDFFIDTELWNVKFKLTAEINWRSLVINVTIDKSFSGIEGFLALKCIITNHNPCKEGHDYCIQDMRQLPRSFYGLSIQLKDVEEANLGFLLKGMYTCSVHILMNKPVYEQDLPVL